MNETEKYWITIRNYGLIAANVNVSLHVCSESYLEIIGDSEENATVNPNSSKTLTWEVKAKKEKEDCKVWFEISGGAWWPNLSSYKIEREVDILKEEKEENGGNQPQPEYRLYFTKPVSNEIEVVQGLNKTIEAVSYTHLTLPTTERV